MQLCEGWRYGRNDNFVVVVVTERGWPHAIAPWLS